MRILQHVKPIDAKLSRLGIHVDSSMESGGFGAWRVVSANHDGNMVGLGSAPEYFEKRRKKGIIVASLIEGQDEIGLVLAGK
jgi:hypothetical protein